MLPLIVATGVALAQVDGCSKDTDCKGTRVCENRVCVEPQPPQQDSSSARRHRGLFLRPDIGFGYVTASTSDDGSDYRIYGAATYFGFAIGGSLADGVILAGHLWGMRATNPTVTLNGEAGSMADASLSFAAIGPEFDYYVMPVNLFFSGTLALSRSSVGLGTYLSSGGISYNTQVGAAAQFAVGKEWWVSDYWGLGVKGELTITSNKATASSTSPTWMGFAFAVGFSATYN